MIVNNSNSSIGTQNNVEVMGSSLEIANLLRQISTTLRSDVALDPVKKEFVLSVVNTASQDVRSGRSAQDTVLKSLGALTAIGSISALVSRLIDLF